jgi:hypothetical protein
LPVGPAPAEPALLAVPTDGATKQKVTVEKPKPLVPVPADAAGPYGTGATLEDSCDVTGDDCAGMNCDDCPDGEICCPWPTGQCPSHKFWVRAEYLLWSIRGDQTPALVTSSPPTSLGVLGKPGTSVLIGGNIDNDTMSGGRFTLGMWCDPCQDWGVEATFLFLGSRSADYIAGSNGVPLLARPFFNTATGAQDAQLVANPAIPSLPSLLPLTGRVTVHDTVRLWGAELNGIMNLCRGCWYKVDLLGGFRFLQINDNLDIDENLLVPASSPSFAGAAFGLADHFNTHNDFYGGQVGIRSEFSWRRWVSDITFKLAMGDMHERVDINGSTLITPPGGTPTAFTGGLLAQPTNIGQYNRDRFAVIPDIGINLGYQITDRWRAFVGFDALYVSNVARPGNEIDPVVNPSQLPSLGGGRMLVGPARPAFTFRDTDFWAYGVNFGFEFRY